MSYGGHFLSFAREFLDVAAAYDKEREITADMNMLYKCDAYAVRYRVPLDDCCPERASSVPSDVQLFVFAALAEVD